MQKSVTGSENGRLEPAGDDDGGVDGTRTRDLLRDRPRRRPLGPCDPTHRGAPFRSSLSSVPRQSSDLLGVLRDVVVQQPGVPLRGRDARMAERLLERGDAPAAFQILAGTRQPQLVGVAQNSRRKKRRVDPRGPTRKSMG